MAERKVNKRRGRSDTAKSTANRGYERLRGQTLEAGAPLDLKEAQQQLQALMPGSRRLLFNTGHFRKFRHWKRYWLPYCRSFRISLEPTGIRVSLHPKRKARRKLNPNQDTAPPQRERLDR